MACRVNLCELLVLYFLSYSVCLYSGFLPPGICPTAVMLPDVQPFGPGHLESWCLVLSLSLMTWGDYVLCKTHADSGRVFCLQCSPVLNRENKDEGRSMSGGSISLCVGGHYWGLGTSHPV